METLKIENHRGAIVLKGFDDDKEMEIEVISPYTRASNWLTPDDVKKIIGFMERQLKAIGEPVDNKVK